MSISSKKVALSPSTTLVSQTANQTPLDPKPQPYLVILSGCDKGKHFRLDRQRNVFGRSDEADIVIGDPKISRFHGVLSVYQNRILFEDMHSTNGTFLAGERISKYWLDTHHRFLAGDTLMRIDYKCNGEALSEQAVYRIAYTDAVTGALNRGAFMQRAHEEFSFCKRHDRPLALVLCNIDGFKHINDRYGLLAGDLILKELAAFLTKRIRQEDVVARYGGDEFIMLLRETPESIATDWAAQLEAAVMQHVFVYQGQSISIKVSIGISRQSVSSIDSLSTLMQSTEEALQVAKRNGRNRI